VNLYAPPLIERTLIGFLMGRKAKTKQIILFFNRFRLAHDQIASWLPFGLNKSSMGFALYINYLAGSTIIMQVATIAW
jgi:hypothetical protein